MHDIIYPGAGVIFMKVGTHAQESLEDIIKRKTKEIDEAGYALWGYGGNTCHPRTMVQPFAEIVRERGHAIHLVMQEMDSHHFAEQIRATHSSVDGLDWQQISPNINVRGSRFALKIKNLRHEAGKLQLANSRVVVGNSAGRAGSKYIQGRVDKACLEITDRAASNEAPNREIDIHLVAELAEPYAVLLKS